VSIQLKHGQKRTTKATARRTTSSKRRKEQTADWNKDEKNMYHDKKSDWTAEMIRRATGMSTKK